jgi:hypothetical protein
MTEEINRRVERHDKDLCGGIVPKQDTRDETVRNIKEYLKRPITASAADDKILMTSGALRRHANLDAVPEHEYARLVREHREARGHK